MHRQRVSVNSCPFDAQCFFFVFITNWFRVSARTLSSNEAFFTLPISKPTARFYIWKTIENLCFLSCLIFSWNESQGSPIIEKWLNTQLNQVLCGLIVIKVGLKKKCQESEVTYGTVFANQSLTLTLYPLKFHILDSSLVLCCYLFSVLHKVLSGKEMV